MYMRPSQNIQPYEDLIMQEAMRRQKQLNNQQFITSERSTSRGKYLLSLALAALFVLALVALALFFLYS